MTLRDKKVGFCQIARFPHPRAKDIMTIGRMVVVPEFQGFGLGVKFMNEIAKLYEDDRIRITTSLKPFMMTLNKNKNWKCVRSGRVAGCVIKTSALKTDVKLIEKCCSKKNTKKRPESAMATFLAIDDFINPLIIYYGLNISETKIALKSFLTKY